jgi:alkaline phosphatase isozyme conversion protein
MRRLAVRWIIGLIALLATGLLLLPACAWLTRAQPGETPGKTPLAVALQTTPTGTLPLAPTAQATLVQASAPAATPAIATSETLAQTTATTETPVDIQIALKHLQELSERIGPRQAGTASEAQAAQYIEEAFNQMGYQASLQPFTFRGRDGSPLTSSNVVAVKDGLSSRSLIVGAHYDSVPVGKGADDNASGVAVMLQVAEMVKDMQTPYTIRFVAFGAEEAGLYGSAAYAKQMSATEVQEAVAMINLDSLIAGDTPNVYGNESPETSLRNWLLAYSQSQGLELQTQLIKNLNNPDGSPCDCSDYSAFQALGIPFAYFEATDWTLGNRDGWTQVDPSLGQKGMIWNTQYDYLDYIKQHFPGRVEEHLGLFIRLIYGAVTLYK